MSTKKKVVAYTSQQLKVARLNFIRSLKPINEEPVHDYRVALKRIRAIISFTDEYYGDNRLNRMFKIVHLKRIFKAGGALRELHVNKKILREYQERSGFIFSKISETYRDREKMTHKALAGEIRRYQYHAIKRFEQNLIYKITCMPENLFLELIDQFINQRIGIIESLIQEHHVEENLHRIRKRVKSIKYMLEMAAIRERSYGELNFTIPSITTLEDLIGNWHDRYVFRNELLPLTTSPRYRKPPDNLIIWLLAEVRSDYNVWYQKTVQSIYSDFAISK